MNSSTPIAPPGLRAEPVRERFLAALRNYETVALSLDILGATELGDAERSVVAAFDAALATEREAGEKDKRDAARWRAFLDSDRIRFFGTAGPNGDYAHFGGEFWTRTMEMDSHDEITKRCRKFLIQYADAAATHPTETPHA